MNLLNANNNNSESREVLVLSEYFGFFYTSFYA
jgi:hypothetical protein